MIPFRFHLVSLTAVFLALALGVVIGSTVIDRAIVDVLENRIDAVSGNLERRREANERLEAEVDRLEDYVDSSAGYAVDGRLEGQVVTVVASRNVPREQVEAVVGRLYEADVAGAQVLWLEPSWRLDEEDQRRVLAEAVGLPVGDAVAMRRRAWSALVDELRDDTPGPVEPAGVDAGQPPPEAPTTLQAMVDAGFVNREVIGVPDPGAQALAGEVDRLLVVADADEDLDAATVLVPMVERAATAGIGTVVAEISRGDEARAVEELAPSAVRVVRDDAALRGTIATVDHLERPGGPVVAVLVLAERGTEVVGHYGTDDGAGQPLPEFSPQ